MDGDAENMDNHGMDAHAFFDLAKDGKGGAILQFEGPLLVCTAGELDRDLHALDDQITQIDLSKISEIDTVGAWLVISTAESHEAKIVGADERASRLIEALEDARCSEDIVPDLGPIWRRVPEHVGKVLSDLAEGVIKVIGFVGRLMIAFGQLIRHPSRIRGRALVRQMEMVGVTSLPIIGLMSFLIGVVIAQQGAVQLSQFGAEALTVNLVGRLTLRELGVLMTAIMVAGRSGSAFAAQIGTMQLTEEVDAMRTIGISPVEALVVPRILASTFMMILLGFFASAMAIIGGAFVADLTMGIPFLTFLTRIKDVVPAYDLWVGLIKAPVFGLIVGIAGCYNGLQVKGDSEQVGRRTTQAVVSAIFMVIVVDAFFAVFFTEIGWA